MRLFYILLFSFLGVNSIHANHLINQNQADTTKTFVEDKMFQMKMAQARNVYSEYNYFRALEMYEQLYSTNRNSALLNMYIGECHFALKQYDKARIYLERAKELNENVHKELDYLLGQLYHRYGDIENATKHFEKYLPTTKQKSEDRSETLRFLSQLKTAKELINNPINVSIKALPTEINSVYDDYAPSISADGQMMIFTSRRTDTKGRGTDPNDMKFYEDIYISMWDTVNKSWGKAEPASGRINTEFHDASLSLSPDGTTIFIYKNVPGETQSGDIYFSKFGKEGKWASPKPMPKPVNSSYFESSASLSADGKYLYFISERNKGYGRGDIYRSKKISKDEWGVPENLGPVVNSAEDEISVFIHPDGKTLFFSSERGNSMGGYDVFKTVFDKGKWSEPENLGYPINSFGDDLHFVMSTDNKTAYFSSVREDIGVGARDIFVVDMVNNQVQISKEEIKEAKKVEDTKGLSIVKGTIVDSDAAQTMEIEINFYNNSGEKIASTMSSAEGEYFITLPGNQDYKVNIVRKGYIDLNEEFNLPLDDEKTFVKVKNFIMNRVPVEPRKKK
jgi:tetratricopeptide (TPR) repeat protein